MSEQSWEPGSVLRPRWSSASLLLYAGMIVVLVATGVLIGVIGDKHGDAGTFAWVTIVLIAAVLLPLSLERTGRALAGGLLAVVAVVVFAVWLGLFFEWIGFLPETDDTFFQPHFEPSLVLLELATIGAGLFALRWFRFPLLLVPVTAAAWYGVVDLDTVFFGHDASDGQRALLSLIVGLVYVLLGMSFDRRGARTLAFWLHATGGLAAGGAVLVYWHSGDTDWLLTLLVSFVYLAAARALGRSSYAVFAVVGILAASTHFISSWTGFEVYGIFVSEVEEDVDPVSAPLLYILVGLGLMALGLLLQRREGRPPEPAADPAETS